VVSRVSRLVGRIRRALRPGDSVGDRAVTGGVWMVLLNAVDKALYLVTYAILARLLAPSEFGLVGLALLVLAVLQQCSKLGLNEALVQHEDEDVDAYLDTTWVLRLGRGLVIATVAYVAAPAVAASFDASGLVPAIRVLALVPLLTGLRNPGVVYFQKDLDFHREFAYKTAGTVGYTVAAIGVALVSPTVWALVAGTLARRGAQSVASYAVHDYRPGVALDLGAARELLGFGKWIFGSGLVLLALNWGDDAVIGWVLGASALGLYRVAFTFSNAPATEITQVVSSVTFPAFSQVQDDVAALRSAFDRTIRVVTLLTFPMAAGIALVAPHFASGILGEGWGPMVTAMRVLAVWGALRSLVAIVGPLFQAVGHPEYSTALQTARLVVFAALLYPATATWGIAGAAAALVGSALVENPVALYLAVRTVDGEIRQLLRSLAVPLAGTGVMAVAVHGADRALGGIPVLAELVVLVVLGVVVYGAAVATVCRTVDVGYGADLATIRGALQ